MKKLGKDVLGSPPLGFAQGCLCLSGSPQRSAHRDGLLGPAGEECFLDVLNGAKRSSWLWVRVSLLGSESPVPFAGQAPQLGFLPLQLHLLPAPRSVWV